MTEDEWAAMISGIPPPATVSAVTYRNKKWGTFSLPAVFQCDDGNEYVVKSPRVGAAQARAVVTEQIVSSIGRAMGAPVADVRIVDLPAALLEMSPEELGYLGAGLAHGSKRIAHCSERAWLMHTDVDDNRARFAALAVLYGWTAATDHQLIYRETAPELVFSVDHGFFFGSGPNWTVESLRACQPAALYQEIVRPPCNLVAAELSPAIESLSAITNQQIAAAVAQPPASWNVSAAERIAVARFLEARQQQIVAAARPDVR